MIINETHVSFAGRVPSPRYIPVGVTGDNCVECVAFDLPTIDTDQTATLLLRCKYADAVTLERNDGGLYCTDITEQIAGESGKIEAYIRVDGANGATWNSEPFFLCVCNVPNISGDISDKEQNALEQTLTAISQLNAAMKQHGEAMEEYAGVANACAENAVNAAERAEQAASQTVVEIDDTLTREGKAADAAAVGARIGELYENKADQFTVGDGLMMSEDRVLSAAYDSFEVVWENAKINSEFGAQTIQIDLSDAKAVFLLIRNSSTGSYYLSFGPFPKGIECTVERNVETSVYVRKFTASDDGITFSNPTNTQPSYLIPIIIWKLK